MIDHLLKKILLFVSLTEFGMENIFKNQQVSFIDKLTILMLMHTMIVHFLKWEWVLIDLSSCILYEKQHRDIT